MTGDADGGADEKDRFREKFEKKVERRIPERDNTLPESLTRQIEMQNRMREEMIERMVIPYKRKMQEFRESWNKYQEEVQEAVESTIELDVPWQYDPDESMVHERAERIARNQLYHLLEELEDVDDTYLLTIRHRTRSGGEAYIGKVKDENGEWVDVAPRPHEAIFLFISMQDGLMHWLCEQDETVEPDDQHGSRNEYKSDTKQKTLKAHYTSSHGLVSDGAFEDNLWAFYKHRNYIMHGNSGTHFDMNIATAAILFFVLTLHTVLEVVEDTSEV